MARICIDPGHGQFDNVGLNGYREGTWMWELGRLQEAALVARGHTVVNTRPLITDKPSLSERGSLARGCDLFMSTHSNASRNQATQGATIYDSVSDKVDKLEAALVAAIAETMETTNNGVRHRESTVTAGRDYYGVLRAAWTVACPDAMLVEHGYHTNPHDCEWLLNLNNLAKLAESEADVITAYYGGTATIPTQEGAMSQIGIVQVASHLNVRSAPSASASDIGDLTNGAQVLILATADGWHKIQWAEGVAYVSSQYIAIQEYHEAELPAPDLLATITEKNTEITALAEKVTFLVNEVGASQLRVNSLINDITTANVNNDILISDLRTLTRIIRKYED